MEEEYGNQFLQKPKNSKRITKGSHVALDGSHSSPFKISYSNLIRNSVPDECNSQSNRMEKVSA